MRRSNRQRSSTSFRATSKRTGGSIAARRIVAPILALLAIASLTSPAWGAYTTADDLPGPPAHLETIPAGSLVIPMDTTHQAVVAPFNLKAYGLVNDLLQRGIPVKWAIKAGKAKDAVDFTATAQRIAPSAIATASRSFSGGPFIVHRDFAQIARTRIAAFGQNVAVYELTADATVDVRDDLRFKPEIVVSNVNSAIHTANDVSIERRLAEDLVLRRASTTQSRGDEAREAHVEILRLPGAMRLAPSPEGHGELDVSLETLRVHEVEHERPVGRRNVVDGQKALHRGSRPSWNPPGGASWYGAPEASHREPDRRRARRYSSVPCRAAERIAERGFWLAAERVERGAASRSVASRLAAVPVERGAASPSRTPNLPWPARRTVYAAG